MLYKLKKKEQYFSDLFILCNIGLETDHERPSHDLSSMGSVKNDDVIYRKKKKN